MIKRLKLATKMFLGKTMAGVSATVFPDDVFIVSYPRSGNTWVRFLIGNLLFPAEPVTFANIEQKIPDIYQNSDRAMQRLPRPRLLKSHECFCPTYRKVIYVVRDPRDVAVSYYHFSIKTRQIDDEFPIVNYVSNFVADGSNRFGSWKEHVGSWLGARGGASGFILLRYEDMLQQPHRELDRIVSFLGVSASKQQVENAIERSSAGNMRQLEREQINLWRPFRVSRQDKPFVRSAKAGDWRDNLPGGSVREIEEAWGEQMQSLGYDLTS